MKTPCPTRRSLLAAATSLLVCTAARAQTVRENRWAELVPPGWDAKAGGTGAAAGTSRWSDDDPRAIAMLQDLRAAWDAAPTRSELDRQPFRLSGYVVPLEQVGGEVTEFLLVPYFGACIHTPPPPANQIVHVMPARGGKGLRSMDVVTVQGQLRTERGDSALGVSGYRLEDARVEPYKPAPR